MYTHTHTHTQQCTDQQWGCCCSWQTCAHVHIYMYVDIIFI